MSNKWIANVIQNKNGDLEKFYFQFPNEITEQLGLKVGDLLKWNIEEDGKTITVRKEEEQE